MTTLAIDTDPGLDDALAILLALSVPGLEVLGLTTVAGNLGLEVTTRNALAILEAAGRADVPVIRGADLPLERAPIDCADLHGEGGLGGWTPPPIRAAPLPGPAWTWLAEALDRRSRDSIELVAIGPLTNPARMLREAPGSFAALRRLTVMGGALDVPGNVGGTAEFNFAADPEAAAEVLRSDVPIRLVPLDVTRRVRADRGWVDRVAAAASVRAQLAARFAGAYFAGRAEAESRPLHDPCAVLAVTDPHLFRFERVEVEVVTAARDGEPGTLRRRTPGREIEIALGVEADAVLARLETLLAA